MTEELIVGGCLGFIGGIWFHHLLMRCVFNHLKSEIGSRDAGNWEKQP